MKAWKQYLNPKRWHPAAQIFPVMSDAKIRVLAADISKHGLLEPVALYDGKVLDGRNRLLACDRAGMEPKLTHVTLPPGTSPLDWVLSANLHRRHLTSGQRAALALEVLPLLKAEAKERQRAAGGFPYQVREPG